MKKLLSQVCLVLTGGCGVGLPGLSGIVSPSAPGL